MGKDAIEKGRVELYQLGEQALVEQKKPIEEKSH